MLSRDLGGIQQVFLDYDCALKNFGYEVFNVTSLGAKINQKLQELSRIFYLPNLGTFDFISILYLQYIIYKIKPDVVIAHGNRAIKISHAFGFRSQDFKLVCVAHNYNTKHFAKCDYVIALTQHMYKRLISLGFDEAKITVIPNSVRISINQYPNVLTTAKPSVIGVLARFVKKKGVDVLIRAACILKNQGENFRLVIGGDGEESSALKTLVNKLDMRDCISFVGWVQDKEEFFSSIDIFCIPSLHEPFGVITLEAMLRGVPIVATKNEGALEIIEDGIDGLLCEINNEESLAFTINRMLKDEKLRALLAKNAYKKVKCMYSIEVAGMKLHEFFMCITQI